MQANAIAYEAVQISAPTSREFGEFYAIYEEALPKAERKSRTEIEKLVTRRDYRLLALLAAGRVCAFAIVFVSTSAPVALLEYMATEKGQRNQGLGGKLFAQALAVAATRVLLVEVDAEREQAADTALRARRKQFYLRHGCIQIPKLDYRMPTLADQRPPMMDLLVHPNGQTLSLDPATLRTWLEVLYVEVYGRPKSDPAITRMLAALQDMSE